MSIIRELLVRIKGDSTGLEKATDKGKVALTGFAKVAERVGNTLKYAVAIGVGAVTAAITASIRSAVQYAGTLDDTAKSLGVATAELAKLQYAAKLSGVEVGAFNGALNLMRKNIADAAVNGGPLIDSLNSLGLSIKDLAGLTPDQQFMRITAALNEMPAGAARTDAAFALFGRGAASLIPLLNEGVDKITELGKEAENLGIALNDIEAQKLAELGDHADRVTYGIQGMANAIALEFLPYMKQASSVSDDFVANFRIGIGVLHDAFLTLGAGIYTAIAKATSAALSTINDFVKMAKSAINTIPFVELDTSKGIGMLERGISNVDSHAQKGAADMERIASGRARAERKKADDAAYAQRVKERQEEAKRATSAAQKIKPKASEASKSSESKKADEKIIWNDDFERQWEAMSKRARETALDAMGPAQRGVERYIDTMKDARKNNEDWANAATKGMQGFEDALVSAATTGKLSFKDMFNSIAADIARIMIRRSVTEPLANAAGNFLSNINWGSIISGARAVGGPVMGGQPYLVGERGPELFVPSSSGGIVPNDKMSGGGQQVIVQQSLNFGLGVQQGVRQELTAMMPQILAQTQQGVQVAIERGGTLSRSVGRR